MRNILKQNVNLTNIAIPSLIANDLVIVHPMTSFSGSIAYLSYVAATKKGDVEVGEEFNSVFGLGKMTEARQNYTAQLIVESVKNGEKIGLTPITCGKFVSEGVAYDAKIVLADGTVQYKYAADIKATFTADAKVYYFSDEFQMEKTPATEIPSIKPIMKRIALVAEPRRIAVKYDQITA